MKNKTNKWKITTQQNYKQEEKHNNTLNSFPFSTRSLMHLSAAGTDEGGGGGGVEGGDLRIPEPGANKGLLSNSPTTLLQSTKSRVDLCFAEPHVNSLAFVMYISLR